MRVLGIDPGSTVTAWGVVEKQRGRLYLVGSGHVRTSARDEIGARLRAIFEALEGALLEHAPDTVAIESIFKYKSSESALRLGQARGVALLAVARAGLSVVEYNPMTIKQTVGAWGGADKAAVARMVKMLLGEAPAGPADVTDAVAIAICHHHHGRVSGAPAGVAR
jgi:crossover junction endodeoxyribonuclease RuvC